MPSLRRFRSVRSRERRLCWPQLHRLLFGGGVMLVLALTLVQLFPISAFSVRASAAPSLPDGGIATASFTLDGVTVTLKTPFLP